MKRKFVTNLALVLFLNLLVKPFWIFGIDRTVQNVVGADGYGFYFSLFSFSLLLNILLDLGITNFNNRSIARDPDKLPGYFSRIVGLKFEPHNVIPSVPSPRPPMGLGMNLLEKTGTGHHQDQSRGRSFKNLCD